MRLANQEAIGFGHEYIGTEHILLGIVKENSGVAANVLKNLDVDLRKVRSEVEKIVAAGPEDTFRQGELPQTPRAKKVIEYAIQESRNLGHNYVGTEHLLLGLLREEEGVAAQALMNLGLTLNQVREVVLLMLGQCAMDPEDGSVESAQEHSPAVDHLPEVAKSVVTQFDGLLDQLQQAKEAEINAQNWDKAAAIRDCADKVQNIRASFLQLWPK